ncbi:MAG: hypothetical protein AAGC55_11960 [Myxococcota bacterium]
MPHSHIECIAYEINTFPETSRTSNRVGTRISEHYTATYRGASQPAIDVDWRIALMKEAIEAAHEASLNAYNPSVLKLFMAPEFYFRGATGAYDFDTYQDIVAKLRALVTKKKYQDWLFVFGSLLVTFELSPSAGTVDGVAVGRTTQRIQNVVLVQEGGTAGSSRTVVKEHMSGIDFVRESGGYKLNVKKTLALRARLPGIAGLECHTKRSLSSGLALGDVTHVPAGKKRLLLGHTDNRGAGKERQKKPYDGRALFESRAVCYGVEVCLDHGVKRLRQSPVGKGNSYVQVQLIPSAGMSIKKDAVVAMKGGIVFNCDGNRRSDVQVVDSEARGDAECALQRVPVLNQQDLHRRGTNAIIARQTFSTPDTSRLMVYRKTALPMARSRGTGLFA